MWCDSVLARGNTQRLRAMPSASARAAGHNSSAAAWSTFHEVLCSRVYGKASMRLRGVASRISAGARRSRFQACGLSAAISLKRLYIAARRSRCSATPRPCAARKALSTSA